jgi:hypothetical protein
MSHSGLLNRAAGVPTPAALGLTRDTALSCHPERSEGSRRFVRRCFSTDAPALRSSATRVHRSRASEPRDSRSSQPGKRSARLAFIAAAQAKRAARVHRSRASEARGSRSSQPRKRSARLAFIGGRPYGC